MTDRCQWPSCRQPTIVGWLGKGLCSAHWEKLCGMTDSDDGYRKVYGILRIPKKKWSKHILNGDKIAKQADAYDIDDTDLPDLSH